MSKLFFVLTILGSINIFAKDIKVNIPQNTPVMGESFSIEFVINTDDSTDAEIEFDTLGIDVLSKSPGSYTSRTTFINGKYSSVSTMTYSYELVAPKSGFAYIRNIKVHLKDKVLRHSTLKFNVLKQARKARDIFAQAHLDKENAYVGESVLVRYYLYNKASVPVNSTDIKKFPKLKKLLKRYHQEKTNAQRVRVGGELYTRRVIYTAQVYAQSSGEYWADPISFRVSYSKGNNSYNNFGFGLRLGRQSVKTVRSKKVKLNVIDLPGENVPVGFTGLVGKHEFNLKINKNKFLVNEPIEIKLDVQGPGALEVYEPPSLLNHDSIEEFEKNSDLEIANDFTATKKVEYTYLGRNAVSLNETNLAMSYFDPETKKYVTENIVIDPIIIAGIGSPQANRIKTEKNKKIENTKQVNRQASAQESVFKPLYKTMSTFVYNAKSLIILFIIMILLYLFYSLFMLLKGREVKDEPLRNEIIRDGLTYARLHRLLGRVDTNKTMKEIIHSLELPVALEHYYLEKIERMTNEYERSGQIVKIKAKKTYVNKLVKIIDERTK